jgi:hypothetical protein
LRRQVRIAGERCQLAVPLPYPSQAHVSRRPDLGITARGDAHHEDFVWYCGHAVDKGGLSNGLSSGFDQGRRAIYDAFHGVHDCAGATYWGNTREFKQCDGDYAGSNGNVGWWRIPDGYH